VPLYYNADGGLHDMIDAGEAWPANTSGSSIVYLYTYERRSKGYASAIYCQQSATSIRLYSRKQLRCDGQIATPLCSSHSENGCLILTAHGYDAISD
jgi:hypothetical protein